MRRRDDPRARAAGYALLELLFALGLLATVLGTLLSLGSTGTRLCETGLARARVEGDARRALDRLARELRGARAGSLAGLPVSPLWQDAFDLDLPVEVRADDGRVTWGACRVELRRDPGEADDGLDGDGDGLVDEGRLVLVQGSGADALEVVLAHGVREYGEGEVPNGIDDDGNGLVDERGFALEVAGRELRLHLTLEARDGDGRTVVRALTTTVRPRN